MGRFIKSTNDILQREHRLFSSHEHGPITVRCHEDGVTATTANGLTVELSTNTVLDGADRELFESGVEITVDGELVGHLTQSEHGFMRSARGLNLVGVEPGRYPEGALFRLRGIGAVALEDRSGRLVRYLEPLGPIGGTVRAKPGVTPEMMAILAAVRVGLYQVLQQAVTWKR